MLALGMVSVKKVKNRSAALSPCEEGAYCRSRQLAKTSQDVKDVPGRLGWSAMGDRWDHRPKRSSARAAVLRAASAESSVSDGINGMDFKGRCELHGVIASQGVLSSQGSGLGDQPGRHLDDDGTGGRNRAGNRPGRSRRPGA